MRLGLYPRKLRRSDRHGFTLIEILLVIALLGLLASMFVAGASDYFRAQDKSMKDVFWDAVQAARLQAVEGDQTVDLRFDERKKQLQWGRGEKAASLPWPGKILEFVPVETRDTVLIGGQLRDTSQIKVMKFFADGTTENYRIQLIETDGRILHLEIDPWTCAPIIRLKPQSR